MASGSCDRQTLCESCCGDKEYQQMRVPQTTREWRVAWLSALDQRDIARSETEHLRRILSDLLDAHYSEDEDRARALRAVAREVVDEG